MNEHQFQGNQWHFMMIDSEMKLTRRVVTLRCILKMLQINGPNDDWWYESINSFEGTENTKMRRSACGVFLRPVLAGGHTAVRRTSTDGRRRCLQTSSRSFPKISFPSESPVVLERSVAHALISPKNMSTKATNKLPSSYRKDKDTLRSETKVWLEVPIGTWTQKNVSKGRFLIREWSESSIRNSGDYTLKEQAVAQTQIIRRWMEERQADKGRSNSMAQAILQSL